MPQLEERLKLLDALDPAKRALVDTYSRQKIVDQHPEWIRQALTEAPPEKRNLYSRAGRQSAF